jgi:hypothetical protein
MEVITLFSEKIDMVLTLNEFDYILQNEKLVEPREGVCHSMSIMWFRVDKIG